VGWPGAKVHRELEEKGLEYFVRKVAEYDRRCRFRDVLAFMQPGMRQPKTFTGDTLGSIADEIRGYRQEGHWSELWKIFIPEGERLTLAEMTCEERLDWRERSGRAESSPARQFAQWYRKTYGA